MKATQTRKIAVISVEKITVIIDVIPLNNADIFLSLQGNAIPFYLESLKE